VAEHDCGERREAEDEAKNHKTAWADIAPGQRIGGPREDRGCQLPEGLIEHGAM
jgi:hypothetical protein